MKNLCKNCEWYEEIYYDDKIIRNCLLNTSYENNFNCNKRYNKKGEHYINDNCKTTQK